MEAMGSVGESGVVLCVGTLWSARCDSGMFCYYSCSLLYCCIILVCLFQAHYKYISYLLYSMQSHSHISKIVVVKGCNDIINVIHVV
jgi:hypothetical protein